MCLAYAKKSLMLVKKIQLRWKYHSTYKNAEKKAVQLKKQKDYKNASKWFSVAAMLRKRHAIFFFNGIMDIGHEEFYNNTVKAAEKCKKKAINIKKHNQNKE